MSRSLAPRSVTEAVKTPKSTTVEIHQLSKEETRSLLAVVSGDRGGTNGDPGCSSATDDSESPDPADTTSPTVLSTSPTDGATGVARNTNVVANFSEPMKASTITTDTFKLYRCSSTKVSSCTTQITNAPVSLSADGRTATLNPYGDSTSLTSLLLSKNKYKAVVTTGAQDVAGNPLDQDSSAAGNQEKVWYFTTGSR